MVANHAELRRVGDVLDSEPGLLVEQEQMHVVQEGDVLVRALLVVAPTDDHQTVVNGQHRHRVAHPSAWRNALLLYLRPLCHGHLAVDEGGLEVLQLVLELTLLVLPSEVVNALHDHIAHSSKLLLGSTSRDNRRDLLGIDRHSDACGLVEGFLLQALEEETSPLVKLEVEV